MFKRIRDVRIAKGMSQVELSEKSGVSRFTIIALESGSLTNTHFATLHKIAKALEVTIDDLFFDGSV